ncbi:MAG: DUF1553 domain-containing protein [Fuerstiella sp.]|nr:DUF1553 domain-containing protein [Fuerstiella sp.]
MKRFRIRVPHRLAPSIGLLFIPAVSLFAEDTVSFVHDIRPVLSDHCFFCHGPDRQEGDLRLDVAEVAYESGAVVPHNPAASELIHRITATDPEERMPPPHANRQLDENDIAALRAWIERGATFEQHWAFRPVPPLRLPEVTDPEHWIRNPIDRFVLQRLQQHETTPSPPADRERLLRRVTLDLTGLTPTIEEIDSHLTDDSRTAWDKVIRRLLESPAFGEQMTQQWVDVARYADTFGYDNDNENHLWPWRDWVIRAFNQNLPYSDFIRWQLAGDLLPNPSQDQLVATAFNRLHRQNAEGGVLPEEFVVEYVIDRTQTFGTAFLGLTIECARCHDHKFDPISQRDFYGLYAMFANIDELGTYAEKTTATPTPNTFVYTDKQEKQHKALKEQITKAELALAEEEPRAAQRFRKWIETNGAAPPVPPEPAVHLPFDTRDLLPATAVLVDGKTDQAVRFSGDAGVQLKDHGDFERTNPFSIAMWLRPWEFGERMVVCHNTKPVWEVGHRGIELAIDANGCIEFSLCHFWPGNALRVTTRQALQHSEWTHVGITYDGSSRAAGINIYLNGAPTPSNVKRDNLYQTTLLPTKRRSPLEVGARMSELGFRQGDIDEFQLYNLCLTCAELENIVFGVPETSGENDLLEWYTARIDESCRLVRHKLQTARITENNFVANLQSIMIMREKPDPALARVLNRGAYDQPGDEVMAGVPAAILDPGSRPPRNRLELVDWMLRRDHPLVARVAVNRIWKIFFGQGLVDTLEDFGSQGAQPGHPDLLDYLAAQFMDSGWDVKALCRLVVTSATYRQSSRPRQELTERDPDNRLLACGPRHRLSAEQIRDAALTASELLVKRVGGPSVKPTQPPGLWQDISQSTFKPDEGEGQYRRSLYTFWKRTIPPPNMMAFDAVNREVCVARREITVTPNQVLVLLNDPQFVEAARVLAVRVLKQNRQTEPAVVEAFRRITGRRPRDEEIQELLAAYKGQLDIYEGDPDAALKLVSVGTQPRDESLPPQDVAAMTAVVQLLLGFLEFQVKQ